MGTFLAILSYYPDGKRSELNTLVRLGNGGQAGITTGYEPFDINPPEGLLPIIPIMTLSNVENCTLQNTTLPPITITPIPEETCQMNSDEYLRETYWYFLNGAELADVGTLVRGNRIYV